MRYLILLLIISVFASCKKEDQEAYSLKGKWLLTNGEVYAENMEKGGVTYYNHFSATKLSSQMDLSGLNLPIDFISQNNTTWQFEEDFKLNDTISYEVAYERYSIRIYGLENGSARVLTIDKIGNNEVTFVTGERRQALNGVNTAYFNKLYFKRIN